MRYLITGGGGFIGSNIVERLVSVGEEVVVLDNFATGRKTNLEEFETKITLIEGDIRDIETVNSAMRDVDYCLHQAALPSVPRSVADPITCNEVNVSGTLNVLVAARDAGVKRVVLASSSSVYGDTPTLPKVETMTPAPLSPYAVNKITCEYYAAVFHMLYGLETISLRYFNVFGPRQNPKSQYAAVIPIFVTTMLRGERPTIFGDGETSRDFCYVDNAVDANLLACTASAQAVGKTFNVACGQQTTLKQLIDKINHTLDTHIEPLFSDPQPGDVKHSLASIELACRLLDYTPRVFVDEGLANVARCFQ